MPLEDFMKFAGGLLKETIYKGTKRVENAAKRQANNRDLSPEEREIYREKYETLRAMREERIREDKEADWEEQYQSFLDSQDK